MIFFSTKYPLYPKPFLQQINKRNPLNVEFICLHQDLFIRRPNLHSWQWSIHGNISAEKCLRNCSIQYSLGYTALIVYLSALPNCSIQYSWGYMALIVCPFCTMWPNFAGGSNLLFWCWFIFSKKLCLQMLNANPNSRIHKIWNDV